MATLGEIAMANAVRRYNTVNDSRVKARGKGGKRLVRATKRAAKVTAYLMMLDNLIGKE